MAERIDLFRRALAGASRAIAKDPEVEIIFASDNAPASGKTARVPSPGAGLEPRLVAEARGAADSAALRLRYHDARMHARAAPVDVEARAVFDALETARVEALGARAMGGVRENLAHLTEARVRGDAIVRARTAEEVPLATAIGLIARERLQGEAPPKAALPGLKLVSSWIEDKAASELDSLEREAVERVRAAVEFAEADPEPDVSELAAGMYAPGSADQFERMRPGSPLGELELVFEGGLGE